MLSGGSSEPGIVLVSKDTNGNGLADDEWYELAGSEYNSPATTKNIQSHIIAHPLRKKMLSGLTIKVMKDMYIGMITIQQILITQHG